MWEDSEEPRILLFLRQSPTSSDVCRVWEAEVHDEDWGLCHQTPRQLYHGVTGGQSALRRGDVRVVTLPREYSLFISRWSVLSVTFVKVHYNSVICMLSEVFGFKGCPSVSRCFGLYILRWQYRFWLILQKGPSQERITFRTLHSKSYKKNSSYVEKKIFFLQK